MLSKCSCIARRLPCRASHSLLRALAIRRSMRYSGSSTEFAFGGSSVTRRTRRGKAQSAGRAGQPKPRTTGGGCGTITLCAAAGRGNLQQQEAPAGANLGSRPRKIGACLQGGDAPMAKAATNVEFAPASAHDALAEALASTFPAATADPRSAAEAGLRHRRQLLPAGPEARRRRRRRGGDGGAAAPVPDVRHAGDVSRRRHQPVRAGGHRLGAGRPRRRLGRRRHRRRAARPFG